MPHIKYQPKQGIFKSHVEALGATWIGLGGGRGAAKSAAIDRVMIERRISRPGTIGAILMRNYDQVKRYHIDPILRDFPELADCYLKTDSKIILPMESGPDSEIHFTYAEALEDVERRFRSASYFDVFVDQAEQFTEAELREIKQAVRWKNVPLGTCKLAVGFNMGGVGIAFLSEKFHEHRYNEKESPDNYFFLHVNPWDNIEWSRPALADDGFKTEEEQDYQYYSVMTEKEREMYCAERSDYGRNLNSQDEVLRQRDWLGSWKSLEGAYFSKVFDRDATVVTQDTVSKLLKPWMAIWTSMDWGKGHYCVTQWHTRGVLSPKEAKEILGWNVVKPVKFTLTFREYVAGGSAKSDDGGDRELSESDIARKVVELTEKDERKRIEEFFLSPDAFEMSVRRAAQSEIADIIGDIVEPEGIPRPQKADNSRIPGWSLMYNLLASTKRHAATIKKPELATHLPDDEVALISVNCPELIRAIPLLMRDPKNLDDVLKTDKTEARIEQDAADCARYGYKSKLQPAEEPKEVQRQRAIAEKDNMTDKYLENLRFEQQWGKTHAAMTRPARGGWRKGR
jgi:hypothetical protein